MTSAPTPQDLPLEGVRVVEASAGTGKTFTIATLYLRLILERGLLPEQLVVATFTRAATAELTERLRERVHRVEDILADGAPEQPRHGDDNATLASRATIAAALRGRKLDELRAHLRKARQSLDEGVIDTLHGFCHRVLAEFGFELGRVLDPPDLLDDVRALQQEIVTDFWRGGSADAERARLLAGVWKTPAALAQQLLDPRWRDRSVDPMPDAHAAKRGALHDLHAARTAIAGWPDGEFAALREELASCIHNASARTARLPGLDPVRAWARSGAGADELPRGIGDGAMQLSAAALGKLKSVQRIPASPAFASLDALATTTRRLRDSEDLLAANLLHEARRFLAAQLPLRLAAMHKAGHDQAIDAVQRALGDPERGADAAARIGLRWRAALIDEFQDTDIKQWQILRSLFGQSTLVLVGDPKQAIYGFRGGDVYAWLAACAERNGDPLRLNESHRAGAGMCAAINALFSQPGAFLEPEITHPDLAPAESVRPRALLRDGQPMAGLQCWRLPDAISDQGKVRQRGKGDAERLIQSACVGWINDLLTAARTGRACLQRDAGAPVALRPGHIAVLVNTNRQADAMQAALARAGVPAASNLQASVYASGEAGEVLALLRALCDPADARLARSAQATVLLGGDSAAVGASLAGERALQELLASVQQGAHAVSRHGPLPWLHGLIAANAPRLLRLADGERRVANYLQLADQLQEAAAPRATPEALASWFARACSNAGADPDGVRLRLDTDADAVTVATIHAAKGLEYAVVVLPYAGLGRQDKSSAQPSLAWYHDDARHARVAIGRNFDLAIADKADQERRAEEVRKLYVAATRAEAVCVLPWGWVNTGDATAACQLLHGIDPARRIPFDAAGCARALDDLCNRAGVGGATVVDLPGPAMPRPGVEEAEATPTVAREFTRNLERDWRVWSYTALTRDAPQPAAIDSAAGTADEGLPAPDEAPQPITPTEPTLAGPGFGSAVHAVLEQADFTAWRDVDGIPASQRPLIEHCLRAQGLPKTVATGMPRAVASVGACVRGALNAPLPCGIRLCDLTPDQRRAELRFDLKLAPARSDGWLRLLHHHGYATGRNAFGASRLHGLLTGAIDLVYRHAGRYHLIDYKTNLLPAYDAAAMRASVDAHEYDLQYLLYTLALHRWLHGSLPDYAYDTHVGDVYYLFVRDLSPGHGIHRDRPERALIEAMDALFDGGDQRA